MKAEKKFTIKLPGEFQATILEQKTPDGKYETVGMWKGTVPTEKDYPPGHIRLTFIFDKPEKKKKSSTKGVST